MIIINDMGGDWSDGFVFDDEVFGAEVEDVFSTIGNEIVGIGATVATSSQYYDDDDNDDGNKRSA